MTYPYMDSDRKLAEAERLNDKSGEYLIKVCKALGDREVLLDSDFSTLVAAVQRRETTKRLVATRLEDYEARRLADARIAEGLASLHEGR